MDVLKEIIELLKSKEIDYNHFKHEKVHSSTDAASIKKHNIEDVVKAIVLKADGQYIQCVLQGNRKIDFEKVKEVTNVKKIKMAHPDDVFKVTNCKVGSVPPTGNILGLDVFLDKKVLERDKIVFSAGTHYDSVELKPEDFVTMVNPHITNISK